MQDLKQLYQKFLSKECTAEEIKYLMDHFQLEGQETELKEMISAELESEVYSSEDSPEVQSMLDHNRELIRNRINEELPVKAQSWKFYMKVAAVLVLIAASSWYFFSLNSKKSVSGNPILASGDIGPGTNKAKLTLSTGESIDLENASEGLVVNKNGMGYAKVIGGKLTCLLQMESTDTAFNTITTPKGGVYQLVTPDGSKIWLNAASELRFPTSFGVGNRVVMLKGEAYFEIAKDKRRPFIVKTGQQETRVLGTHFNINSYVEEQAITTTLFEGAVRVHSLSAVKDVLLAPGQASVLKDHNLIVQKADESTTPDWVNGKIVFNNEHLKNIMRKVSRWYGVDVEMKEDIANLKFWGSVSRNDNLSAILNYLRETEDLDYRIKGTSVTIFKRENTK